MAKSVGEETLALHLRAHGIEFEREYMFAKSIGRKWRADFFIAPDLLIEVDGGVFVKGRHSGGMGQVEDMNKHNAATILGYRTLRFEPSKHINTGLAIECIEKALADTLEEA